MGGLSMNRRGFLGAMLAACAAPAIVRAGVLMPVKQAIVLPGDNRFYDADTPWDEAPRQRTITTLGGDLKPGDFFTIAGVAGTFAVQEILSSTRSVIKLAKPTIYSRGLQ
jgi:hypothetical protein